jgi:hypothetical protein
VNTPTLPASVDPVKDNSRCNSNLPKTNRSCTKCGYALYPNTGRCTSCECPRHVRKSGGAMTGGELLHEYAPPPLFHGRRWGTWTLDTERLVLVYDAHPHPVRRGDGSGVTEGVPQYTAFLGPYELDLERVADSAGLLDWIFQIHGKSWATARVTKDLLNALDSILHPQASLCSGACGSGRGGKTIPNPGEFLRKRIATVGVNKRPLKDAA